MSIVGVIGIANGLAACYWAKNDRVAWTIVHCTLCICAVLETLISG